MNANETQVGGTHYKAGFQHWDLAHELNLGYFEGQITKYVTRHRKKKGKEDLEKALHFANKLRELAVLCDKRPMHRFGTMTKFYEFKEANGLNDMEFRILVRTCGWATVNDLCNVVEDIIHLTSAEYAMPTDGSAPNAAYVDQGKDI